MKTDFYVVLFDGVCNFCNSSVNFIIKRNKKGKFRFSSLQSNYGKNLLSNINLPKINPDTIILFDGEKYYYKSTAVLKILKELNYFWKLLYVFILIPPPIRNYVYNLISKNRYKWFGKREVCRIPDENGKQWFFE
jgi:predicted DCC family thiol-disulfide oxidoreductase YuxK